MCRTASLFLLQRLKGSMSGDERDFNNIETRDVIKFFFFLRGKSQKEIYAILTGTLGEHAPSYATIKNWVAQFKRGDFPTVMRLVLDDPKQWQPRRSLIKSYTLKVSAGPELWSQAEDRLSWGYFWFQCPSASPHQCYEVLVARQPNSPLGRFILEVSRWHTHQHTNTNYDSLKELWARSRGHYIHTRYTTHTKDEHPCPQRIRTRHPSNQAPTDLRIRRRGNRLGTLL